MVHDIIRNLENIISPFLGENTVIGVRQFGEICILPLPVQLVFRSIFLHLEFYGPPPESLLPKLVGTSLGCRTTRP